MRIINKIRQFFCKHDPDDINVEFSKDPYRIITMPVRGNRITHLTMECRKCGKILGIFRMYGTGIFNRIDNKIYDVYKVDFEGTRISEKAHAEWMLTMAIRKNYLSAEKVMEILRAEKRHKRS